MQKISQNSLLLTNFKLWFTYQIGQCVLGILGGKMARWPSSNTLDNSSLLRPWKTLIPMSFKMSVDFPCKLQFKNQKFDVALMAMHPNWELSLNGKHKQQNRIQNRISYFAGFRFESTLYPQKLSQFFDGGQNIKVFFAVRQLFIFLTFWGLVKKKKKTRQFFLQPSFFKLWEWIFVVLSRVQYGSIVSDDNGVNGHKYQSFMILFFSVMIGYLFHFYEPVHSILGA